MDCIFIGVNFFFGYPSLCFRVFCLTDCMNSERKEFSGIYWVCLNSHWCSVLDSGLCATKDSETSLTMSERTVVYSVCFKMRAT